MSQIQISAIKVYALKLPLKQPYRVSGGRVYVEHMDSVVVSVTTNSGLTGWGEGCPFGNAYLPAFSAAIHAGIAELAPHLIGDNPLHLDQLNHRMDALLAGHGYIKSALDMACWDLLGQHCGLPLYALLGGRFSAAVDMMGVFPNGTPEQMLADLRGLREQGYGLFSAKVGGEVALDIARIRALLAELAPEETITIDANRAWLPDQAIRIMNAIHDPTPYFEQPCETLDECRAVRRLTCQPMILDEAIMGFGELMQAQRETIAQAISIKLGRVGGLTKARRMRDFCVATGLRMNIEETGGTVIASTAAVHLAAATPPRFRLATSDNTRLHAVVPATGGYRFEQGRGVPPERPGLGVEPIMAVLGEPTAVYS